MVDHRHDGFVFQAHAFHARRKGGRKLGIIAVVAEILIFLFGGFQIKRQEDVIALVHQVLHMTEKGVYRSTEFGASQFLAGFDGVLKIFGRDGFHAECGKEILP